MKIHFLAIALLATVAAPGVVSANELRESTECPDGQIPCDISSDSDCRAQRDMSSTACATTWSKGCCTKQCKPNKEIGGRICKIAPPSEDYFGLFGLVEDLEEFGYDSEDPEDMNFGYDGYMCDVKSLDYIDWTQPDLNACCDGEFTECKKEEKNSLTRTNCAMQRKQCYRQDFSKSYSGELCNVEVISSGKWSKWELDDCCSTEFDMCEAGGAGAVASDCKLQKKMCEDQKIQSSKGKGKGKYSGWTCDVKALDYINWTKMDLDACCDGEFNSCENGEEGYVVPDCSMQKQQCEDQKIRLAQVA